MKDLLFLARGDSHVREPFFPWNHLKQSLDLDVDAPEETEQPTLFSVGKNPEHGERARIAEGLEKHKDRRVVLVIAHGEIDMRCHFQKFGETEEACLAFMDTMLERYFAYLAELRESHPQICQIVVYGILPPNSYLVDWLRDPMWGYHRPAFNGHRIDHYIGILNGKLRKAAEDAGYFYFDPGESPELFEEHGFALYPGHSGMQMHLDGAHEVVQGIFVGAFERLLESMSEKGAG